MYHAVRNRLWVLILVVLAVAVPAAANVTVSGNVQFSSLDGSAQDADGVVNGTFTVNGDLTVQGSINCNDDSGPANNSACPMTFAVSGNVVMLPGSSLSAENRRSGGSGGDITINAGGSVSLQGPAALLGGARISTSRIASGSPNSSRAGKVAINAGGTATFAAGSSVLAADPNGQPTSIDVTSGGTLTADGVIGGGPGSVVDVTLKSTSTTEPSLTVGATALIGSLGTEAGHVVLEGCGILIEGTVGVAATNATGASVTIRSGTWLRIDGRDLAGLGSRRGAVRADATTGSASTFTVNLFAREDVEILGPAAGVVYAVSSNGAGTNDGSGTINVVSLAGGATVSGMAISASNIGNNAQGGTINISAEDDLTLGTAKFRATGDLGGGNGQRKGGTINLRSYSGAVHWTNGSGDVRPVGSGSNVSAANQGKINLTYCTTYSVAGTTFPSNGPVAGAFPVTQQACSPAAPSLPAGHAPLPVCNQPPVSNPDAYNVAEGGTLNVPAPGVLGNDSDPDGNPITATLVTGPSNGTLTLNADGSFEYEHDGSETTSDSFTYKANDGSVDGNTTTVTITITPVNDAPVAVDDNYSVAEGGALNVVAPGVLSNDSDPDSSMTAVLVSNVSNGTLALNPDGSFLYTHDGSETTSDSFTYQANDGSALSNTATVTITIEPVNDAPVAAPDAYNVQFGQALNVAAPGVLGNDSDVDSMSLTAVLVSGPSKGTLTLNPDGSFNYQHDGVTAGSDSFTYKANDGTADSNIVTVTITIITLPPSASNDAFAAVGNTELRVGTGASATPHAAVMASVLTNDTDPDSAPGSLTVTAYDPITFAGGTVSMNPNGTFSYLPPVGFTGADTFSYTVSDETGNSDTATVTLTVTSRVWYVNNLSGGGDGRSTTPFNTLASAQVASAAGDYIYVHRGDGTSNGQDNGIVLQDNQSLIGEGVALIVNGYNLAPAGLAPTISSSATGVTLASNNTVAGLTVDATGFGISGSAVNGGTIENVSVTSGSDALVLSSTSGTFNLTNVALSGVSGLGINGGTPNVVAANLDVTTTTGKALFGNAGSLTITAGSNGSTVTTSNGGAVELTDMALNVTLASVNAANGVYGVRLNNTSGSFTANGGTISGSTQRGVYATNAGAVSLSNVTVTTSAIQGVLVEQTAGTGASLTVQSSSFTNNLSSAIQFSNSSTGAATVTVNGSTFTSNANAVVAQTTNGPLTASITNNTTTFNTSVAFSLTRNASATGTVNATVTGNVIGTAGVANSGTACGSCTGINIQPRGNGVFNALISNNQIRRVDGAGINVQAGEGAGPVNLTITNNVIAEPTLTTQRAIQVSSGVLSADTTAVCAAITGNAISGSWNAAGSILVFNRFAATTFRLPGYAGSPTDTTAVAAYVSGNNGGATAQAMRKTTAPANQFDGGAACTMPTP
ncbi:MAG TPA: Ig-like domain-containing protein [Thermoanaerobaculia bacterium]